MSDPLIDRDKFNDSFRVPVAKLPTYEKNALIDEGAGYQRLANYETEAENLLNSKTKDNDNNYLKDLIGWANNAGGTSKAMALATAGLASLPPTNNTTVLLQKALPYVTNGGDLVLNIALAKAKALNEGKTYTDERFFKDLVSNSGALMIDATSKHPLFNALKKKGTTKLLAEYGPEVAKFFVNEALAKGKPQTAMLQEGISEEDINQLIALSKSAWKNRQDDYVDFQDNKVDDVYYAYRQ